MSEKQIEFIYFKCEEELVNKLKCIEQFFETNCINQLNSDLLYNDYAERKSITKLYREEKEQYKRQLQKRKFIPKFLQRLVSSKHENCESYQLMLSLMDILNQDTLDAYDIKHAIDNSKNLFDAYFDKDLKNQKEME